MAGQIDMTGYSASADDFARKRKFADLLRQQSLESPQGQMVSGHYVAPSITQMAAQLFKAYKGGQMDDEATAGQQALAKQVRDQGATDMQGVMGALQGTPEKRAEYQPDTFDAADAQTMPQGMQSVTPAAAPDRRQAMALALQSTNQNVQGVGAELMKNEMTQEKFGHDVKFTGDGKGYIIGDKGGVKWTAPDVTPRDKMESVNLGGETSFINPYAPPTAPMVHTVTPDAVLSDKRKREEINGAESAFTTDAIDNAAARYNIDGTLPPMGMGKTGATGRSAILNRAAVLAKDGGISGDDQRINQIGNKANTVALSQLQKQQTMVGAFEKNFSLNADMALGLSKNVDRIGSPLLNSWLQVGQKNVTGNVALSKFHAANETVINEYAKIMSGSMGNTAVSDSARAHAHSLLSTVQNQDQYEAVMQTLKQETANRMKGFEDEKISLRGSMGGKHDVPQSVAKTQSGVTTSGW